MNLKELSNILGLSQTTVSRALNGYPEVSEATRNRVRLAADKHGYHPNARAKGLATGRAMAIGHVLTRSSSHEIVNPIFGDFISGAGETYSKNGYDILLSLVGDADETKTYRDLKAKGTVDGIIIHGPSMDDSRIALLKELGLPFLVHGRASFETTDYSWIDVNNRQAFFRATSFLLDLGHKRIALINGIESMDFALRRRDGYVSALAERDIEPDAALMRAAEMTEQFGHSSASDMLGFANPPTAFLVSSMISAIGVRRAIEERGLRLGRDISVVTHDDELSYLRNGGEPPIFTATRSSVREAGRRAAEMLLDLIADPEAGPYNQLLEVELMVGQSTGPAK